MTVVVLDIRGQRHAAPVARVGHFAGTYWFAHPGHVDVAAAFGVDESTLARVKTAGARAAAGDLQRIGSELAGFVDRGQPGARGMLLTAARRGDLTILHVRSSLAEILTLPWELLVLDANLRISDTANALVRIERDPVTPLPSVADPTVDGGRIMFAWSAAGGGVPVQAHRDAIIAAAALGSSRVTVEVVDDCSLARLGDRLRDHPAEVLHLLCHGAALPGDDGAIGLALDGADDAVAIEGAALAATLLPHAGRLRLVVLCACQGAEAGEAGSWVGSVAECLHGLGIPSVVASRTPLRATDSTTVTGPFYQRLLREHGSVEQALLDGLSALRAANRPAALQLFGGVGEPTGARPIWFRPYRGLKAFGPMHRAFFHGPRDSVSELVRRFEDSMRLGPDSKRLRPGFQILAGSSGSGKSSLLGAGVAPALRDAGWEVVMTSPAAADFRAVIEEPVGADVAKQLLIVDQFEEIFWRLAKVDDQKAVAQVLYRRAAATNASVVVTFRFEQMAAAEKIVLDGDARLDRLIGQPDHTAFIASPDAGDYRTMVVEPARRVGIALEPELVDELLDAMGRERALPLLEFCLDQLWQARGTGVLLRLVDYRALELDAHGAAALPSGVLGLEKVLVQFANRLIAGLAERSPLAERLARRIFLLLVIPGATPDEHVRRRLVLGAHRPADPHEATTFDEVVRELGAARLITSGGAPGADAWIEVIHDSLLRRWTTLHAWIEEVREAFEVKRTVAERIRTKERLRGRWRRRAAAIGRRHPELLEEGERAYLARQRRLAWIERGGLAVGIASMAGLVLAIVMVVWDARRDERERERQADAERIQREHDRDAMEAASDNRSDTVVAALLLREVSDPSQWREWRTMASDVLTWPIAERRSTGPSGAHAAAVPADDRNLLADLLEQVKQAGRLPVLVAERPTVVTTCLDELGFVGAWIEQADDGAHLVFACNLDDGQPYVLFREIEPLPEAPEVDKLTFRRAGTALAHGGELILGDTVRGWVIEVVHEDLDDDPNRAVPTTVYVTRTVDGTPRSKPLFRGRFEDTSWWRTNAKRPVVIASDDAATVLLQDDDGVVWRSSGGAAALPLDRDAIDAARAHDLLVTWGDRGNTIWSWPDGDSLVTALDQLRDVVVLSRDDLLLVHAIGSLTKIHIDRSGEVEPIHLQTAWTISGCPGGAIEVAGGDVWQRCERDWRHWKDSGYPRSLVPLQAFSASAPGPAALVLGDGTAWAWEPDEPGLRHLDGGTARFVSIHMSADGTHVLGLVDGEAGVLLQWSLGDPARARRIERGLRGGAVLAQSADGSTIASCGVLDAVGTLLVHRHDQSWSTMLPGGCANLWVSADGTWISTDSFSDDPGLLHWPPGTAGPVPLEESRNATVASDHATVALLRRFDRDTGVTTLRVVDLVTGKVGQPEFGDLTPSVSAVVAPGGAFVATLCKVTPEETKVCVANRRHGGREQEIVVHGLVRTMEFSRELGRLAIATDDEVTAWDPATGALLARSSGELIGLVGDRYDERMAIRQYTPAGVDIWLVSMTAGSRPRVRAPDLYGELWVDGWWLVARPYGALTIAPLDRDGDRLIRALLAKAAPGCLDRQDRTHYLDQQVAATTPMECDPAEPDPPRARLLLDHVGRPRP